MVLEPLRSEHFESLYSVAADPNIWVQHPTPSRYEFDQFRTFFEESLQSRGALVIRDRKTWSVIGSTRFHGLDEEKSEVEIGWTFLTTSYWGGAYNREVKSLMLEYAFQFVERVVFLVGPGNKRSSRALEKIGATRAGRRRNGAGVLNDLYEIRKDQFRNN